MNVASAKWASARVVTRYQIARSWPSRSNAFASALIRQFVYWPPFVRPGCLANVLYAEMVA